LNVNKKQDHLKSPDRSLIAVSCFCGVRERKQNEGVASKGFIMWSTKE